MESKFNEKVKVPSQRDKKISDMLQTDGDRIHKIEKDKYCEGKIILISQDVEALHEAVLVTENFLSYNGSWAFGRHEYENGDSNICELSFKWNGYLSIMDIIFSASHFDNALKLRFIANLSGENECLLRSRSFSFR